MNPTLEEESEINRYKGSNHNTGKIIKGTLNDAPIKVKVSSIPSKFENIIFRNNSQPAFGDSKERFYQPSSDNSNFIPGPGVYEAETRSKKIFSKKGLGNFASQTKLQRLQRSKSHVPGPGAYTFEAKSSNKKSLKKKKFNTSNHQFFNHTQSTGVLSSQIQSREIFKLQIEQAKNIPGPGTYQNDLSVNQKLKSSHYQFKSKIRRFPHEEPAVPPVGLYNPTDTNIGKPKTVKYEKVEEEKNETLAIQREKIQKVIQKADEKLNLGPGSYNPHHFQTKKTFKIKQNMYDRFGKLKSLYALAKNPNSEPESQLQPENLLKFSKTTTHMFKSKTKRPEFFLMKEKMDPGMYKKTESPSKKSHLINFNKKWIGV